jgi:hypothetical protein
MRVFARTLWPIGKIEVAAPLVTRDLVREKAPIELHIAATLLDNQGRILSGSAPIHVQVLDPRGAVRHELFQATKLGQFSTTVPLAANDPAGQWKVVVREGLANTEGKATFVYEPARRARSIAGATQGAVYFGNDLDNVFRFIRTHRDVTIVKGKSAWTDAAAKRLAKSLETWGVRAKELDLVEAAKARKLSDEEALTWVGLQYAGSKHIKPGDANPPLLAGFAVQGPVILLGNPGDHAIIDFLLKEKFLPYVPGPNFPGPGRGYVAWQRDGIGANQESITLIAHDEAGMHEAVGTFYQAAAGQEPLTRWVLPGDAQIVPGKAPAGAPPQFTVAWTALLPDRVLSLEMKGGSLSALTHDGARSTLSVDGKVEVNDSKVADAVLAKARQEAFASVAPEALKRFDRTDRLVSRVAQGADKTAVAYWGGWLRVLDKGGAIVAEQQLPQDVSALAWSGNRLIAGLADGRVVALD